MIEVREYLDRSGRSPYTLGSSIKPRKVKGHDLGRAIPEL